MNKSGNKTISMPLKGGYDEKNRRYGNITLLGSDLKEPEPVNTELSAEVKMVVSSVRQDYDDPKKEIYDLKITSVKISGDEKGEKKEKKEGKRNMSKLIYAEDED